VLRYVRKVKGNEEKTTEGDDMYVAIKLKLEYEQAIERG
jgi:hypothetical protein